MENGEDNTPAYENCRKSCNTRCAVDDTSWRWNVPLFSGLGCDWVAKNPSKWRCARVGVDGILASEACESSCETGCVDSEIWRWNKYPIFGCDWVSQTSNSL